MSAAHRLAVTKVMAVAFIVGAVMHFVAVTFALLSNIGERLFFVLTPGGLVARELGLSDPNWPGLLNVGIAMVANGLIYMAIAFLGILAWRAASSP